MGWPNRNSHPGGCLLQNVDPGTLIFDADMATLTQVFANVDTVRGNGNIVIVAYDGAKRDDSAWHGAAEVAQNRDHFAYDLTVLALLRDYTLDLENSAADRRLCAR